MDRTTVGVIGVGHMGRHHARVFSEHPKAELIAVVDTNETIGGKIARTYKTELVSHYREILGRVKAVSIAVPTVLHFEVARAFIESGAHVLVEKPITSTVQEASDLIDLARKHKVILQVGHIERFNAAIRRFHEIADSPAFIESQRLGPFDSRVRDIGVVMDLMIHDLDIVLNIVRSPVKAIEAVGLPILSERVDIANARLTFESGCIATLTASRITPKKTRKIRVFQRGAYVSIDYAKPSMQIKRLEPDNEARPGEPQYKIVRKVVRLKKEEPLKAEIDHFLDCVEQGVEPQVKGEHAQDALALAVEITNMIKENADERAADIYYRR